MYFKDYEEDTNTTTPATTDASAEELLERLDVATDMIEAALNHVKNMLDAEIEMLGLDEEKDPVTIYDLKQLASTTVRNLVNHVYCGQVEAKEAINKYFDAYCSYMEDHTEEPEPGYKTYEWLLRLYKYHYSEAGAWDYDPMEELEGDSEEYELDCLSIEEEEATDEAKKALEAYIDHMHGTMNKCLWLKQKKRLTPSDVLELANRTDELQHAATYLREANERAWNASEQFEGTIRESIKRGGAC